MPFSLASSLCLPRSRHPSPVSSLNHSTVTSGPAPLPCLAIPSSSQLGPPTVRAVDPDSPPGGSLPDQANGVSPPSFPLLLLPVVQSSQFLSVATAPCMCLVSPIPLLTPELQDVRDPVAPVSPAVPASGLHMAYTE